MTESLLSKVKENKILLGEGVTPDHIKGIISILKDEQFSEDNRKNSRLLIDKILEEIIQSGNTKESK